MIIKSTAPCRISLFGGSTDIPQYADKYGGLVISFATNLRSKLTLYTEEASSILNRVPLKGDMNFMRKIFSHFKLEKVKFVSESEALLESGLGTSAASAVATVGAINRVLKLNTGKGEIAEKAWEIETKVIGLYGGRQDQYASAFGGFNAIMFSKDRIDVQPLKTKMITQLMPALVLVHTNKIRTNPKIQEGFKKLDSERIAKLSELKDLATSAFVSLEEGDIEAVGALLDQSWQVKKQTNKGISTPELDNIYQNAKHYGAYGGKLLGSGGGGYMLFIVDPNKRDEFVEKIVKEGVSFWDMSVDWNGVETRVL